MTASNDIAGGVGLLPCPWCGGNAHLDTYGKGGSRGAAVFCDNILCGGIRHGTGAGIELKRKSAIAAWNTRLAAPAEVDARVEAMRRALAELEDACDDLARTRSLETYLRMIDHDGATDALHRLDDARRIARSTLHPAQPTGGE